MSSFGAPCQGIVNEQVDEAIEMADPTGAAGLVAELRFDDAAGDGDDAVVVTLPRDTRGLHGAVRAAKYSLGQCVGRSRRRETWNVPLKEQLVAGGVLQGEAGECSEELLERSPRIPRQPERIEVRDELPVPIGEHRVVEGVLRIEVPVERWLAYSDVACQRVKRDPGYAVLAGQLPRTVHDPGHPRFSTLGHRAGRGCRSRTYHR